MIMLVACGLLLGASAPAKVIPWDEYGEALVIPANSPVRFERIDEVRFAHFQGRFVVTGKFVIDCEYCEPSNPDNQLRLSIIPDERIKAILPRWKRDRTDVQIFITDGDSFIRSVSTAAERRSLLSGKLDVIRGRASIMIEQFETGLECDSATYAARFVSTVKAPVRAPVRISGNFACG